MNKFYKTFRTNIFFKDTVTLFSFLNNFLFKNPLKHAKIFLNLYKNLQF